MPIEDFIVSVVIQDAEGNPVTGNVVLGENYRFFITFEEGWNETMDQIPHVNGLVVYYLPTEFLIPEPKSNVEIRSTAPPHYPVIAYYNVYEDGRVEITFLSIDRYGNAIPGGKPFIEYYNNAIFSIEVTAQFVGVGDDILLEFGPHVIKNITVLPAEPPEVIPGISVVKTCSDYDPISRMLDYELTVTALAGPISNIMLRDGWVSSRPFPAFVWGLDEEGNELTDSDFSTVNISNRFLIKYGDSADSNSFVWKCAVGDGFTPLSGVTIIDTLGPGMVMKNDVVAVVFFGQNHMPGHNNDYIASLYFPTDVTEFRFVVPPEGAFSRDIYYAEFHIPVYVDFSSDDGLYENMLAVELDDGVPFVLQDFNFGI